ncbi:hypothetical protein AXE80_01055 [Wenyingzhuangia fucanilytica]|uniref:Oligosaccharide repeat unit polymerase n=1 Tax=Wenyingzhuangia fucanilytica TaxID=1790137 RepID=A0A1B1Y2G5_9FLAO|nr:hypothetical protein AXE80_01055 [Wenyingzhuangia fucanilytica]
MIVYFIFGFLKKEHKVEERQKMKKLYLKWVRRVIRISFCLTIVFAINILSRYSNLLINNPWVLREMYFNGDIKLFPSISYTLIFLYLSAFLGSSVLYFREDVGRKIYYLPIISSIIFAVVYIGRNEFVKISLIYFIAILLKNKEIFLFKSLKKIFAILLIVIGVSSILKKGSHIGGENLIHNTLLNIGSYGSGSLLVFDIFTQRVNRDIDFGYGEYTFYPVFRRLASIGFYRADFKLSYMDDFESFINTFTYLRPFYSDFGWFGVYVLSSFFLMIIIYFTQIDSKPKSVKKYLVFISLYPAVLFSIQGLEYQTMEYFTAILLALLLNFVFKFKFL